MHAPCRSTGTHCEQATRILRVKHDFPLVQIKKKQSAALLGEAAGAFTFAENCRRSVGGRCQRQCQASAWCWLLRWLLVVRRAPR